MLTPHIYEENIKSIFVDVVNEVIEDKTEIMENCHELIKILADTSSLEKEKNKLTTECDGILSDIKNLVSENARKPLDQDECSRRYQDFVQKHEKAEVSLQKIEDEQENRKFKITYI